MSDSQATTPQAPNAQAGQQGGAVPNTQQGQPPATAAPATPAAAAPFKAFADQAELDNFVKGAKSQAERAAIRKMAKDMGFEDVDEMRETLQALRQAQGGGQPAQPNQPVAEAPAAASAPDINRLQMALTVGAKLNLPAALIGRLQGATEAEMEADAQTLLGLLGSGSGGTPPPRTPGIPPVPAGNQPVTFTQAQMSDPKFIREHAAEIRQARAQGRIVRS